VKLSKTAMKDVKFRGCKMLGLHFEDCKDFLFAVDFDNCILTHSTFFRVNLKKTFFSRSKLIEVDFSEADLSSAVFDGCDLLGAKFDQTILEKSDFTSSYNYSIDPDNNRIKKATFSREGIAGLLDKYDIVII
jgi:fluoroquinolone resistance protein